MSSLPPPSGPYPDQGAFTTPPGGFAEPQPRGSRRSSAPKAPKARSSRPPKAPRNTRPTRRVVSTNRLFALAAAAAIIVLIAAYYYTSNKGTYEAVYSQEMSAGATLSSAASPTTSDVITGVKVPDNLVTTGAFTSSSAQGAVTAALSAISSSSETIGVIPSGTPVLSSQFQPALVKALPAGDQLVSLDANIDNAVGGSLQVGNYIDVYASSSNSGSTATLVASQVQIVAIHASVNAYNNIASQQATNRTLNQTDVLPTRPVPSIYILQASPSLALQIATDQSHSNTFYLSYVAPPAS